MIKILNFKFDANKKNDYLNLNHLKKRKEKLTYL